MKKAKKEITHCPRCGSDDLYDRWVSGRKLQRGCNDCPWKKPPRVPEIQPIKNTRFVWANQFSGFCYETYDKYGHTMSHSRSYDTKEKAREELIKELNRWNKNPDYAPCTGILWPDRVEVHGEVIVLGLESDSE
jgi:hypothetical protein